MEATLVDLAQDCEWEELQAAVLAGADIDEQTQTGVPKGVTALHWAARHNRPDIVRFLLQQGADAHLETAEHAEPSYSHRGTTPMDWALPRGHTEVVDTLLRLGDADKNHFTVYRSVREAEAGGTACAGALAAFRAVESHEQGVLDSIYKLRKPGLKFQAVNAREGFITTNGGLACPRMVNVVGCDDPVQSAVLAVQYLSVASFCYQMPLHMRVLAGSVHAQAVLAAATAMPGVTAEAVGACTVRLTTSFARLPRAVLAAVPGHLLARNERYIDNGLWCGNWAVDLHTQHLSDARRYTDTCLKQTRDLARRWRMPVTLRLITGHGQQHGGTSSMRAQLLDKLDDLGATYEWPENSGRVYITFGGP